MRALVNKTWIPAFAGMTIKHRQYFVVVFLSFSFFIGYLLLPVVSLSDGPSTVVVKVNGSPITLNDVEEEINRIIPKTFFHRNISPEKREKFMKEATERLIDKELQLQESKARGIKAKKKEIKNKIEDIKKNFPSNKEFENTLQHNKLKIEDLEAIIEKEILIEKLFKMEVEEKTVVSDKEIKAHYEDNTQRYKELEQVKIRHIMIRFDKENNPPLSEGGKEGSDSQEIKKTRNKEEAKAMAEELLKRIERDEDFAAIAYEYSDDPYRAKGGDLGYIHRGRIIPEIEALAFDMKIGEVMGPLETEHGFYIIKIEDRKSERQFSFDEVRDIIKNELVEKKKEERTKEWLKTLREKAKIEYIQPISP